MTRRNFYIRNAHARFLDTFPKGEASEQVRIALDEYIEKKEKENATSSKSPSK